MSIVCLGEKAAHLGLDQIHALFQLVRRSGRARAARAAARTAALDIVLLGRDGGRISVPESPSFDAPPEMGDGNGGSTIELVVVGVPGAEPDPPPERNPSLLALPDSMPGEARPAVGNILPSELFDLVCSEPSLPNIFCTMLGSSGCSPAPPPPPAPAVPSTDAALVPGAILLLLLAAAPSRSDSSRALASPEGEVDENCLTGDDPTDGAAVVTGVCCFCFLAAGSLAFLEPVSPLSLDPVEAVPLAPLLERAESFGI